MNEQARNVDVAVCGGGPAGVAAAIASASSGAKTILIERLGRLGGMGTSGLVNQIPLKTDRPRACPKNIRRGEIPFRSPTTFPTGAWFPNPSMVCCCRDVA